MIAIQVALPTSLVVSCHRPGDAADISLGYKDKVRIMIVDLLWWARGNSWSILSCGELSSSVCVWEVEPLWL